MSQWYFNITDYNSVSFQQYWNHNTWLDTRLMRRLEFLWPVLYCCVTILVYSFFSKDQHSVLLWFITEDHKELNWHWLGLWFTVRLHKNNIIIYRKKMSNYYLNFQSSIILVFSKKGYFSPVLLNASFQTCKLHFEPQYGRTFTSCFTFSPSYNKPIMYPIAH